MEPQTGFTDAASHQGWSPSSLEAAGCGLARAAGCGFATDAEAPGYRLTNATGCGFTANILISVFFPYLWHKWVIIMISPPYNVLKYLE